ncbi:MAG: hypothetical protein JO032_09160 [Alphaproteobacteria bacterium]|nr:hypothetical protein [Alphaproteobacteria bacterium]
MSLLEDEVARLQGLDAIREDVARLREDEIPELTRRLRAYEDAENRPAATGDRFRRAKIVISKALHPNNFTGDAAQQKLRGDLFKEIWPQLEKIEKSGD